MTIAGEQVAGEILELRAKLNQALDLLGQRADETKELKEVLDKERKGFHTLLHLAMDAVGRGENLNYQVGSGTPHGIGFHGPHAETQKDLHRLARRFWDYVNGIYKENPDVILVDYVPDPPKKPFASTKSADGRYPI